MGRFLYMMRHGAAHQDVGSPAGIAHASTEIERIFVKPGTGHIAFALNRAALGQAKGGLK
jgi:hypothetical protein